MISQRTLYLGLGLAIIISLQWLPVLQAKWSIRDDQRFVQLIVPRGRISFAQFVQQLNPPDLALGGTVNRPIYNVVHAVWMLIIGDHLHLWQGAKILTFAAIIFLFFILFSLWTEFLPAVALSLYVGFQADWFDVVPRANSELFALFGLALYAIGNSCILLTSMPRGTEPRCRVVIASHGLVALGGVVAVASKENFCFCVLLSSVCLLAFAIASKRSDLALAQVIPLVSTLLFSYLIINGIAKNQGHALYGQTFDIVAISRTAFGGFAKQGASAWLPAFLMVFYLLWFLRSHDLKMLYVALFELLLIGIVLLNLGFYVGFQMIDRYAFPVNILPAFSVLPVLWKIRYWEHAYRKLLVYSVLLICSLVSSVHGFSTNIRWSLTYQSETRNFDKSLRNVIAAVAPDQAKPIVFESYDPSDYEPLLSVRIFLRTFGVGNPIYVKLDYTSDQLQDEHIKFLAKLDEAIVGPGKIFQAASDLHTNDYFWVTFSSPNGELQRHAVANFYGLE